MHWRQSSRRVVSSFPNHSKIPATACVDLNLGTLTVTFCFSVALVPEPPARVFPVPGLIWGESLLMRPVLIVLPAAAALAQDSPRIDRIASAVNDKIGISRHPDLWLWKGCRQSTRSPLTHSGDIDSYGTLPPEASGRARPRAS